LVVVASTRAPGFVTLVEPEIAWTRTSPFTPVTVTLPDALFARKSSPKSWAVIEPLAEDTCTDRSTLLTAIDPDADSTLTGPCTSLMVWAPDATVVVTSVFRGTSIV